MLCRDICLRYYDLRHRHLPKKFRHLRKGQFRLLPLLGTTTLLEHPIHLRRTKVERGCLLCRLWGRLILSEFGVCPQGQAPVAPVLRTRSYMQVAATRQEHPIRLRRSEVEPGYLLCRLPGNVTAPEFGVCPHTRRGQPHTAQRRASDDDANASAKCIVSQTHRTQTVTNSVEFYIVFEPCREVVRR